jgi:hypothetical protein
MARSGEDVIHSIIVNVHTHNGGTRGTDGDVYLIFAGREFNLNLVGIRDRRPGARDRYRLGGEPSTDSGSNVENPDLNNPGGLRIHLAWDHPVGLRFAPQPGLDPPDHWDLVNCWMSIFTNTGYEDFAYLDGYLSNLTLGSETGLTVYLEREIQSEDKAPLKHKQEIEYQMAEAPRSST